MGKEERIAWLCRQANSDELERLADDAGAGPLLARMLEAARSGNAEIQEQDLDALDRKFTGIGIDSLTFPDAVRGYQPLPGTSEHPVLYAWICPRQICSRVEAGTDGGQPPVCGLTRLPLLRQQLHT
jgi:hypothetical protein